MRSLAFAVVCAVAALLSLASLTAASGDGSFTVSGLSAGGAMAVQLHFAFSSRVTGAGILAGIPYWCAYDNVAVALTACMEDPEFIVLPVLDAGVAFAEITGSIDPTKNLAGSRVYLYSGTDDTVVVQGVMKKLLQQYEAFDVRNFKPLFSHQSEHGMPTVNKGVPCMTLETPFIIKCNYSAVTDMLNFIYDIDITPAQNASAAGQLWSVTQSAYLPALWTPETASVGSTAYAYVPSACLNDTSVCAVHVALHGCLQNLGSIGLDYVTMTGYNEWAAAQGKTVILYPQCDTTTLNPNACWDWWAYTGADYATKWAPQPIMITGMVDALQSNSLKTNGMIELF